MADDIDIEEHDVMDHPTLRSTFPDLSVVKNEIIDYGIDEVPPSTKGTTPKRKLKEIHPDSTSDIHSKSAEPLAKVAKSPLVSSTQADFVDVKPNIIHDDKPPAPPAHKLSDKIVFADDEIIKKELDKDTPADTRYYGNRIILGKDTPTDTQYYGNRNILGKDTPTDTQYYGNRNILGKDTPTGTQYYGNRNILGKDTPTDTQYYGNRIILGKDTPTDTQYYGNRNILGKDTPTDTQYYGNRNILGKDTPTDTQYYGNRIILGKKRKDDTAVAQEKEKESSTSSKPTAAAAEEQGDNIDASKIIEAIHSSPDRTERITKQYNEMEKCFQVKVLVTDCAESLQDNKCYCSRCQVLFPTASAYNSHYMSAHIETTLPASPAPGSPAGVVKVYSCHLCARTSKYRMSLVKHYAAQHGVRGPPAAAPAPAPASLVHAAVHDSVNKYLSSTLNQAVVRDSVEKYMASNIRTGPSRGRPAVSSGASTPEPAKSKPAPASPERPQPQPLPCSHCADTFSTKEELINHLYEILTKKFECNQCSTKFETQDKLNEHSKTHKVAKIENKKVDSKLKTNVKGGEASTSQKYYYVCGGCSWYIDASGRELLEAHVRQRHRNQAKRLLREVYTPRLFQSKCLHCDLNFNTPTSYNKHAQAVHPKARPPSDKARPPSDKARPPSDKPRPPSDKPRQPSDKAKPPSDKDTDEDKEAKRPVVKKLATKELPSLKVNKKPVTSDATGEAVPKCILFKCDICSIHFLSYVAVAGHLRHCAGLHANTHRCDQCGHTFKKKNQLLHQKQHLISEDFRVLTCSAKENLAKLVMNNCPTCGVHFSDLRFMAHLGVCGEHPPDAYYCTPCDLLLDTSMRLGHVEAHQTSKPGDFIIINYELIGDDNKVESKSTTEPREDSESQDAPSDKDTADYDAGNDFTHSEPGSGAEAASVDSPPDDAQQHGTTRQRARDVGDESDTDCKQTRSEDSFETIEELEKELNMPLNKERCFRYCRHCDCYFLLDKKPQTVFHRSKHCVKSTTTKSYCKHCGLRMFMYDKHTHKALHEDGEVGLRDLTFFPLWGRAPGPPPAPRLPRCGKCGLRYQPGLAGHRVCKGSRASKPCAPCGDTIDLVCYSVHKQFHEYKLQQSTDTVKDAEDKPEAAVEKKYKLYQCSKCSVVLLTSGSVETHRSGKYSCAAVRGAARSCADCRLALPPRDYRDHRRQHDADPDYRRDNFQIIRFSESGVEQSPPGSSDDEVDRWSDDGDTGRYVFYQCRGCGCCVQPGTLRRHGCCPEKARKKCGKCRLWLSCLVIAKHYELHKRHPDMTDDNIRVVRFGRATPRVKTRKIRKDKIDRSVFPKYFPRQNPVVKLPVEEPAADADEGALYQCQKCKMNFYENVVATHVCVKRIPYRCVTCRLTFNKEDYARHISRHAARPDYRRDQLRIVAFNTAAPAVPAAPRPAPATTSTGGGAATEPPVVVYKCGCGEHYFTKSSVKEHFRSCTLRPRGSQQRCSKCQLVFSPAQLFQHLVDHHADQATPFRHKVVDIWKIIEQKDYLYKCNKCSVHFVEKYQIIKHFDECEANDDIAKMKCAKCKLVFAKNLISNHKLKHHDKYDYSADEYHIVTLNKDDVTEDEPTDAADKDDDHHTADASLTADRDQPGTSTSAEHTTPDKSRLTIYRCIKCDIHFITRETLREHAVTLSHRATPEPCHQCHLAFTRDSLATHHLLHHVQMKLNFTDFIIIESHEDEHAKLLPKIKNVLYKCRECEIHFTQLEYMNSHLKSFHLIWRSVKTCRICGLDFSSGSLPHHVALHHERRNLAPDQIQVVEYPLLDEHGAERPPEDQPRGNMTKETLRNIYLNKYSNKVYKCEPCDVCFMTRHAFDSHVSVLRHRYVAQERACARCGLRFLDQSLARHVHIHHDKLRLTLDTLDIRTDASPPGVGAARRKPEPEDEPRLYKCKECDNHFVTQVRCYRHIVYDHAPIPRHNQLTCDRCGLNFLKASLLKHKQMHHTKHNYTLKDIIIEEYEPLQINDRINCVGPKVTTYIAADRVPAAPSDAPHEVCSDDDDDTIEPDSSIALDDAGSGVGTDETKSNVNTEESAAEKSDDVPETRDSCAENLVTSNTDSAEAVDVTISENDELKECDTSAKTDKLSDDNEESNNGQNVDSTLNNSFNNSSISDIFSSQRDETHLGLDSESQDSKARDAAGAGAANPPANTLRAMESQDLSFHLSDV